MLLVSTLLAVAPFIQSDTPDLVVLTSGKEIECRVLYEDDTTVVYTKKRNAKEVARAEVASVQSIERSLREFLERYDALDDKDVTGLHALADFCESRELFGEARHLRIRILTLDPENVPAWEKLGGVHTKRRGWRLKVRGRFYTLTQLRERVSEWKHAMEVPTAHFLIKTDVAPERALDLALDVERAYLTFYELLGSVLRLHPFDEVPEIHVYSSTKDYPKPRNPGDLAWYGPSENILYVDAEASAANHGREAAARFTDVLLWNSLHRTVGKSGSVPAWVRDGLDETFSSALDRKPGHASWDFSRQIPAHFAAQNEAEKPLSLADVVRAGFRASKTGTNSNLHMAQSYTLVQFLVQPDQPELRAGFGKYLESSFAGKSALTHLEKALGMKAKEIEERWIAYVQSR